MQYARERQVPRGPLHDDYGGRMPQGSSHDIDGKQMPGGPSNDVNGGLLNSEIFRELRSLRTEFETFMRRQDEVERFMRRHHEALKNFMDEVHGWMHSFGIASGANSGQVIRKIHKFIFIQCWLMLFNVIISCCRSNRVIFVVI